MSEKTFRIIICLTLLTGLFAGIGCTTDDRDVILGVEVIEEALPFFDKQRNRVRDPQDGDQFPPMRVLLSRDRYWVEDKHMDVVVQLDASLAVKGVRETRLHGRILNLAGEELVNFVIDPQGERLIFYPVIPRKLLDGGEGKLELEWIGAGGETMAFFSKEFRVERFDETAATSGSIPISVPNEAGAVEKSFPVTVGVPFPRGAVDDISRLRLVAVDGNSREEIPMQVSELGRWSRFGSVKWVHVDFTIDLPGSSRELELEYGQRIRRRGQSDIQVQKNESFPVIDAGRLRFADGLWFDAKGDGNHVKVLDEQGLHGAFVERGDKRFYRVAAGGDYEIEETGSEKIVLKREGWYVEEEEKSEFCKYITRYIIHRDSPMLRIFHTWIFTGDGNHDRIANMGWEFALAEGFEPAGFLTGFGGDGSWQEGDYLLQYDYEHFDLADGQRVDEFTGGRSPGVAAARGNGLELYLGIRDFWQNYPSELEFRNGSLWFHNWPRHNRPARYTFEGELITSPGEPALASAARHDHYVPGRLTRSEWKLNLLQARFAHEGEMLNFRLPDRVTEDPVFSSVVRGQPAHTHDWIKGEPESINSQGISRTEEMWLYLTPEGGSKVEVKKVLEGLNEETLRGVVDPSWISKSGAFYEIHHRDVENYPEEEHLFEQLALAPGRWQEQLGMYGMWLYGDMFAWGELALDTKEPQLYRALRKGHHGWPYSWIPYVRSGDSRFLKIADAAIRQLIDASYTHYVSEELLHWTEETYPPRTRRKGLWNVGPLPWSGQLNTQSRSMHNKIDCHLSAWYMTGYHRAKDNLLCWAIQSKKEESLPRRGPMSTGDRNSNTMLKSWLATWEITFDPWYLVAAHSIAKGHRIRYEHGQYSTHGSNIPASKSAGHFYNTGDRDFQRFSGNLKFQEYYMAYADFWGGHWHTPSWQIYGAPMVESNVYAWQLTGEEYYLMRVADFVDWLKVSVWDGEGPDYVRGYYARGSHSDPPQFTGWALQYFPLALATLEEAGHRPEPVPDLFEIDMPYPVIAIKKQPGQSIILRLRGALRQWGEIPKRTAKYSINGPDGTRIMSNTWQMQENVHPEIPAEAPGGTYTLKVENAGTLVVPVTEQTDIPEVMIFRAGEEVVLGRYNNQAWFYVPGDIDQFQVQIPLADGHYIQRISIWNPEGQRAWDMHYHRESYKGEDPVMAVIKVEPGQADRLWRITLPGNNSRFTMDLKIPPVYSVARDRWFMPESIKE